MSNEEDVKEYFECSCRSAEHLLTFEHFYEEIGNGFYENELLASTFLNHRHNVFSRTWLVVKYVFGFKVRDGHFDCTIIEEKDVPRLMALCQRVIDKGKEGWTWDEGTKKYSRMEDGVKVFKIFAVDRCWEKDVQNDDNDYYKVGV